MNSISNTNTEAFYHSGGFTFEGAKVAKFVVLDKNVSQSPTTEKTSLVADLGLVADAYDRKIQDALADKKRRWSLPIGSCSTQILHDIGNVAYVAFRFFKHLVPVKGPAAGIAMGGLGLLFSVAGGVLNIFVGLVVLREAIQAFRNGDIKKGVRFSIIALALISIGLVMILTWLSAHVAILGFFGAIVANPYVLPILVAIVVIPLLGEILKNLKNIATKQDPYSKMHLDQIEKLLEQVENKQVELANRLTEISLETDDSKKIVNDIQQKLQNVKWERVLEQFNDEIDEKRRAAILEGTKKFENLNSELKWEEVIEFYKDNPQALTGRLQAAAQVVLWNEVLEQLNGSCLDPKEFAKGYSIKGRVFLCEKVNDLRTDMGAEGALSAIRLFHAVHAKDKTKALAHVKTLKNRAKKWKRSKYIRLFQQALTLGSIVAGFVALNPHVAATSTIVEDGFMTLGLGIPLYLDIFEPFLRNSPIEVENITLEELNNQDAHENKKII